MTIFNYCILCAQNDFDIPPGTVQVNDSLYIDKSPVTNLMFMEYLTAKEVLKNKGYLTFNEFIKDTNEKGFSREMTTIRIPSPLLIEFYSSNKYLKRKGYGREWKFRYHPVLNVSKIQAFEFCKWRTEMVSHLWKNDEKYSAVKSLSNKISYRLATKKELELANTFFSNSNMKTEFTEKILKVKQKKMVTDFIVFPIQEMTISEELFNQKLNYEYIGFRCICEIEK